MSIKLHNQIVQARQAYYFGGQPIMSDEEYDRLEDRYRELCPNSALLDEVGTPFPPDNNLVKVEHPKWSFMGSLFKINEESEFFKWTEPFASSPYHVSLKADGASLALYYRNGNLVRAVTRGSGFEGEDVTANAVKMKGCPTRLPFDFTGVVRSEVVLKIEDWLFLNPNMDTNPRNVGNGIMGRKDGTDSQYLSILATDMTPLNPIEAFSTETHKFEWLENMGFETVEWLGMMETEAVVEFQRNIAETRHNIGYWIDGIVVRVESIKLSLEHGFTSNRPKAQRAWKFVAEEAETVLLDVELSVGHTGAIIPTGVFEPVQLGGTTVKRALLNNWDEIERLGVMIGDTVTVVKANDIIPKIIGVVSIGEERREIPEPVNCPVCGAKACRETDKAMTRCQGENCSAKQLGKIKRWVKSLNILHVGEGLLENLYNSGAVREISDLYRLDAGTLSRTAINDQGGVFGDKRAKTAFDNIQKSRVMTVSEFFGSIGFSFLGKRRAQVMIESAPELGDPENWLNGTLLSVSEKAGVPEIGRVMDQELRDNQLVRRILEVVEIRNPVEQIKQFSGGHTFCITGKLPSGRVKKFYQEPLERRGHRLSDNVDKDIDYLVVADPASQSAKVQKAKKLGIPVISENQLEGFCGV